MRRFSHADLFNFHRDGCFGSFTIKGSERQSIFYTSTVFRVSELDYLKTAKEVLTDQVINFDAMIQRDIVPAHVHEIESYLSSETSTKDVRFFPPLLVALIGYHDGKLDRLYKRPDFTLAEDGSVMDVCWGDVFKCRFGVPRPDEQVRTVGVQPPQELKQSAFNAIAYLSSLQINTEAARLVVVDGQHRLRALQRLAGTEETRELIDPLTIPACIMWPAWAYEASTQEGPDVIESLRRIFVDVNSKAKQVSGHFSILLKDDHIAAIGIREICENLRKSDRLHFVEWNQHVQERANQLTWFNKVTSVGILWQGLVESGATRAGRRRDNYIVSRVFPHLLKLDEVRDELDREGKENCRFATITNWDRDFTSGQREYLRQQLQRHFAPCAARIYTELRPFYVIEGAIEEVFREYEQRKDRQYNAGIDALRTMSEPEADAVVVIRREVHDVIRERVQDLEGFAPTIYRTQRFQQGLWAAFYHFYDAVISVSDGMTPSDVTGLFLEYMNEFVFAPQDLFFANGAPWLENVVTQGSSSAIIKRQSTRQAVSQLLLSRLGAQHVAEYLAERCVEGAADKEELRKIFMEKGDDMAAMFIGEYRRISRKQFIERLEYDESLGEDELGDLQALRARAEGDSKIRGDLSEEEAHAMFLDRIGKIVDGRIRPHLQKLAARLEYTPTHLHELQMLEVEGSENDMEDDDG